MFVMVVCTFICLYYATKNTNVEVRAVTKGHNTVHLSMPDFPLMLWVKLPFVRVTPQYCIAHPCCA